MKNRTKTKYQAPIPKPKNRERGELGSDKYCKSSDVKCYTHNQMQDYAKQLREQVTVSDQLDLATKIMTVTI